MARNEGTAVPAYAAGAAGTAGTAGAACRSAGAQSHREATGASAKRLDPMMACRIGLWRSLATDASP